jgi:hypothetical protein
MDAHRDGDVGIEVDVPAGWEITASEEFPLLLLGPAESEFRANVGISTGPLVPPDVEHLAQVVEQAKAVRAETGSDYEVEDEWRLLHDGAAGWIVRARWAFDEAPIEVVQVSALYLTKEGVLYQVHCTTLAALAERYLGLFADVLESLHFVPPDDTP